MSGAKRKTVFERASSYSVKGKKMKNTTAAQRKRMAKKAQGTTNLKGPSSRRKKRK